MEISYSNDGERSDDDPYSLFIFAINAEETKQKTRTTAVTSEMNDTESGDTILNTKHILIATQASL